MVVHPVMQQNAMCETKKAERPNLTEGSPLEEAVEPVAQAWVKW